MSTKSSDDNTYLALRYPDFHSWRNLNEAMARGGFWKNGEPVRISDPEMKPQMDEIKRRLIDAPEFAQQMLQKLHDKSTN